MKKTLIALALSAVPLSAVADVTLYGTVKGGVDYIKEKSNNEENIPGETGLSDWGSYIGFKGEEDLGNGLKAIWQIEQKASLTGSSHGWASRDSFIGLAGGFGTLRAGYLSDTFKTHSSNLDPWESGSDVRKLKKFSDYGQRYVGVRYDSPDWAGFSFNVLYSPKGGEGFGFNLDHDVNSPVNNTLVNNSKDNSNDYSSDVLAVGLGYSNYGWFANYGYKNIRNVADAVVKTDNKKDGNGRLNAEIHSVGIGYDNGTVFAGLGYRNSRNFVRKQWDSNDFVSTFAYTFGNIVPRISYAYGQEKERYVEKNPAKSKYNQVIVGLDYNLSKRTAVLASLGYWSDKPVTWGDIKEGARGSLRSLVSKDSDKKDNRETAKKDSKNEIYSFGLGLRHKF